MKHTKIFWSWSKFVFDDFSCKKDRAVELVSMQIKANIFLKGVHPIIYVSNIFPNSHLIQKCIQFQQLFIVIVLYSLTSLARKLIHEIKYPLEKCGFNKFLESSTSSVYICKVPRMEKSKLNTNRIC